MTQPRDEHDGSNESPSQHAAHNGPAGPGGETPRTAPDPQQAAYPYDPQQPAQPPYGSGQQYAGGPGWTMPGASGGWGPAYAPGWSAAPPRRHRAGIAAAAAVLVLAGAGAGIGIGHGVWGNTGSTPTQSNQTFPNSNGNGSGTSPFNGNGTSPFNGNEIPGNGFPGNGFPGNGNGDNGNGGSSGQGSGNTGTGNGSGSPSNVDGIASKVSPALVDINADFGYQNSQGAGTGIVMTSNGEILTNNHVIDGATSISVTDVGNGKTYKATVVGYDNSNDVAVLQLKNASGLKTAAIGDSSKLSVGQGVVAIGNAGGTGGTPSRSGGSITALHQSITASDELDGNSERLSDLIQVNANVQAGDSGGSLVNSSGKVVGIDTAASSQFSFQNSSGAGYAIPINDAISIADKIEDGTGTSTIHVGATAFLGVSVGDATNNMTGGTAGAQVGGVLNGGAADDAGLTAGDVITSLNGHTISSADQLSKALVDLHPGDKVAIAWTDTSGQTHTGSIQLASGPPA